MPPKRGKQLSKPSLADKSVREVPSAVLKAWNLHNKKNNHKALKEVDKVRNAALAKVAGRKDINADVGNAEFDEHAFALACAHHVRLQIVEDDEAMTLLDSGMPKAGKVVWDAISQALIETGGTCAAVNAACATAYIVAAQLSDETEKEAERLFSAAAAALTTVKDESGAAATRAIRREFNRGKGECSYMRHYIFDAGKSGEDYALRMSQWEPVKFRRSVKDAIRILHKQGGDFLTISQGDLFRRMTKEYASRQRDILKTKVFKETGEIREQILARDAQEKLAAKPRLSAEDNLMSVLKTGVTLELPEKQKLSESDKRLRQLDTEMIRNYWSTAERKAQELFVSVDAVKAEIDSLKHNVEHQKSMERALQCKETLNAMLKHVESSEGWIKFTCPKCKSQLSHGGAFREHVSKHYPMSLTAAGVEISSDIDYIFSSMQLPGKVGENTLETVVRKDARLSVDFDVLEPKSIQDFAWLQRAEEGSSVKLYQPTTIKDTVDNVPDFVALGQVVKRNDAAQKWRFPDSRANSVHVARKRMYFDALERLSENCSDAGLRDGIVKHCTDPMLIPPIDSKWAEDDDVEDGYGNEFLDNYYNCMSKDAIGEMNWLTFFEQEHKVDIDASNWRFKLSSTCFPSFSLGSSLQDQARETVDLKPDRQTMEEDIQKALNLMYNSGTLTMRLLQSIGGFVYAKEPRSSLEKRKSPVTMSQLVERIHHLSIGDLGALWAWVRSQFIAKEHLMAYTLVDHDKLPPSVEKPWFTTGKDADGTTVIKFSSDVDSPVSHKTDGELLEEILKEDHIDSPQAVLGQVDKHMARREDWKLDDKFAANLESAKNAVQYFVTFSDLIRDVLMVFNSIITSPLLRPDARFHSEEHISEELCEMVSKTWSAMKFFDVTEFRIRKNSFTCEWMDHRRSDQHHLELIRPSGDENKPKDFTKMQFLHSVDACSLVRENTLKSATGYVVDDFDDNVASDATPWIDQLSCMEQSKADMLQMKMEQNQSIADELKEIRDFAQSLPARAATLIALAQRHLMDVKLKLEILSAERIELCMKIVEDAVVNHEQFLRTVINSAFRTELLRRARIERETNQQRLMDDLNAAELETQAKEERKNKTKEKEKAKRQARKELERKEKEDRERDELERLEALRKAEEDRREAERQAAKAAREAKLREQDRALEARRIELETLAMQEAKVRAAELKEEQIRKAKEDAAEAKRRKAEAAEMARRAAEMILEQEMASQHDSAESISSPDSGDKTKEVDIEHASPPLTPPLPAGPPPPMPASVPPTPPASMAHLQAPQSADFMQLSQYMQAMAMMPMPMMPQPMYYAPPSMPAYYPTNAGIPVFEETPQEADKDEEEIDPNASFVFAVIKTLWHVVDFRDEIIDAPTQRQMQTFDEKALKILKRDFLQLEVGDYYDPSALCGALSNFGLFNIAKTGPSALYSLMLKTFHRGLRPLDAPSSGDSGTSRDWLDAMDGYRSAVHANFGQDVIESTTCSGCSKCEQKRYTQFIKKLPMSTFAGDDVLPFAEMLESLKGEDAVCESCGEVARTTKSIRCANGQPPEVFTFAITWGSTFLDPDVIQSAMDSIPHMLALSDISPVTGDADCANEEYRLKAVMCSRGDYQYLTLIKADIREDRWLIECEENRSMVPTAWQRAMTLCKQGQTAPKLLIFERRRHTEAALDGSFLGSESETDEIILDVIDTQLQI